MVVATLAALFSILACVCSAFILTHAFRQSVGTGVMVLCIPCFIFSYAFHQFEHPRKGLIVSGWLASVGVCVVLLAALMHATGGPPPVS
jgi:translocator protein